MGPLPSGVAQDRGRPSSPASDPRRVCAAHARALHQGRTAECGIRARACRCWIPSAGPAAPYLDSDRRAHLAARIVDLLLAEGLPRPDQP